LYYTYSSNGDDTLNRVSRYKFEDGKLINEQVIIDVIPGAVNHNGGRIKFGPDKFLYISTGDAQNPSLAQDKNSLAGKILRVTDEGKAPPDNPFADAQDKPTLIYSYGHRNPQGLTFDNQGRLWATEHGPQALDELNLIEKGKNYGWPIIQGDQMREGMVSPVIQSGSTNTWAPAGATFLDGSIFFGGLAGQSLFEYKIADKTLKRYFQEEFGRIREVVLGPDGYLYITTSNTDGRGSPKEGDDRLIKVNPDISR
ncbi:MAG: PQQ-dependent sugar dehydrogenase, partial [bacterium]|nr:PQQ-dependent sugar dehydrogenase [bacterium]